MQQNRVTGGPGFASGHDVATSMSARAARRSARTTRPGLMHPSRAAAEECGIFLGRQRGLIRRKVYATLEDVVLTIAPPPRSGKTAWLAGAVLDAPGPALVTSTRGDVYDYTAEIRQAKHGPPLYVFNLKV